MSKEILTDKQALWLAQFSYIDFTNKKTYEEKTSESRFA